MIETCGRAWVPLGACEQGLEGREKSCNKGGGHPTDKDRDTGLTMAEVRG